MDKPPKLWRLLAMLVVVIVAIVFLSHVPANFQWPK